MHLTAVRQFAEIMISVDPLGALVFKWDADSKRTPRKAIPTVGTWYPNPVYGYGAIGPNAAYMTVVPSTRARCLALSTAAKKGEPKGESSVAKVSALLYMTFDVCHKMPASLRPEADYIGRVVLRVRCRRLGVRIYGRCVA